MTIILFGVGVMLAGGFAALLLRRFPGAATAAGAGGVVLGALLGLAGALRILLEGSVETVRMTWGVPNGSFYCSVDGLSAFFLLPILGLSALAAIYGAEYLWAGRREHPLGAPWFFLSLLAASMTLVVLARNAVLFLVAWEVMSLASFFLVTIEHERESVRRAGWTYLVATHLGTVFLFIMFVLMGRAAGSLDFSRLVADKAAGAGLLFVLALIGFGTKAGLMPLHVWLPEAHPEAPSHVSAIMSGVMIKTGIYGLMRMLTLLGPPAPWWGWTLVAVGAVSGVLGVLFALAQHDLKRLLAYHSVENIGIITMGLGLGVLGRAIGSPALAALGFAGALLHTLNHAVFKGLLFLGAGSVQHAAHTLDLERLGGLMRRMPVTAWAFLTGAVAICGLPPFNGFASEFLIYLASFRGVTGLARQGAGPALAVMGALALIGGLAAACFAKAFGIVFLGEPRGNHGAEARDPGPAMRWPMIVLSLLCLLIGLLAPLMVRAMAPAVAALAGGGALDAAALADGARMLGRVVAGSVIFLLALGALALARRRLLAGRSVGRTGTWDCGYARPAARMQYTASSFAQPITDFFGAVLRTHKKVSPPAGLFPGEASLETHTPDVVREVFFRPVFGRVAELLARLHALQTGSIHLYILYIAVTLIALLIWKLS